MSFNHEKPSGPPAHKSSTRPTIHENANLTQACEDLLKNSFGNVYALSTIKSEQPSPTAISRPSIHQPRVNNSLLLNPSSASPPQPAYPWRAKVQAALRRSKEAHSRLQTWNLSRRISRDRAERHQRTAQQQVRTAAIIQRYLDSKAEHDEWARRAAAPQHAAGGKPLILTKDTTTQEHLDAKISAFEQAGTTDSEACGGRGVHCDARTPRRKTRCCAGWKTRSNSSPSTRAPPPAPQEEIHLPSTAQEVCEQAAKPVCQGREETISRLGGVRWAKRGYAAQEGTDPQVPATFEARRVQREWGGLFFVV
ncbi:hypothetical protein ACN47E_000723 [Coniothyrium glycines]